MTYGEVNAPVTQAELAVLEARLNRAAHRFRVLLLVLYLAMALVFGLLAYRTEVNANALANGFYQACLVRQDRQIKANVGRETLVQLAANGPTSPPSQEAKDQLVQQLRDALLLPVEDCGDAP